MITENTTSSILSVLHSLAGNVGPAFLPRSIFTHLFSSCQPNFKARCKPSPSHFRPFIKKKYSILGKRKIKSRRHFSYGVTLYIIGQNQRGLNRKWMKVTGTFQLCCAEDRENETVAQAAVWLKTKGKPVNSFSFTNVLWPGCLLGGPGPPATALFCS